MFLKWDLSDKGGSMCSLPRLDVISLQSASIHPSTHPPIHPTNQAQAQRLVGSERLSRSPILLFLHRLQGASPFLLKNIDTLARAMRQTAPQSAVKSCVHDMSKGGEEGGREGVDVYSLPAL